MNKLFPLTRKLLVLILQSTHTRERRARKELASEVAPRSNNLCIHGKDFEDQPQWHQEKHLPGPLEGCRDPRACTVLALLEADLALIPAPTPQGVVKNHH